jgi:hypothetical protein
MAARKGPTFISQHIYLEFDWILAGCLGYPVIKAVFVDTCEPARKLLTVIMIIAQVTAFKLLNTVPENKCPII